MAHGMLDLFDDAKVIFLNTKGWRPRPQSPVQRGGVGVLNATNLLPFSYRSWGGLSRRINQRFIHQALSRVLTHVDLCVTYDPLSNGLCKALAPTRLIYDCVDLYEEQPQYSGTISRELLLRAERSLVQNADLVVATTRAIADKVRPFARRVALLPGAAEPAIFRHNLELAADRMHVAYIGAVDRYKVDMAPLLEVAKNHPDEITISIVGFTEFSAADPSATQLGSLPNVRVHRQLSPSQLATVLRGATVGVVAARRSRYSDGSFPLKIWDYLGMGLAVVAWGVPDLIGISDSVVALEYPDSLTLWDALVRLHGESSQSARQRRREFAEGHLPLERAREIVNLLA
jgi:hypothetical protein